MLSPLLIFFSFLSLYIYTLAPSVAPQGDSGELVTVAYTLGIAHPPGYPLFTLLAHLFTYIPINSIAWRVNLFSAVCSATTLVFIYLIIKKITKNKLAGVGTAAILGLSQTFWLYSLVTEVFALNNLFAVLIIYLALEKRWLLLSFVLGLSLSNHHTIILIFPALAYLIYKRAWRAYAAKNFKFKFSYIFLFLLGLTPYIYFYIRAKTAVMPVAWSYPDNLPALLRLVFRSDYGTFAPTVGTDPALVTLADKGQQLVKFFTYFLEDFWWPVVIPIILGLFVGLKKYFRFTIFLLLAFFLSGIFFLTYANFPLADQSGFGLVAVERFYLLPYLFLALLTGLGLSLFNKKINLILITFYAIMLLINNFGLVNQRNNFWAENLGKNILSTVPENGLLLVQGDIPTFAVFYNHYVENFRPDIEIFTPNVSGQFNDYRYLRSVRPNLDYGSQKILTVPEFILKNYQKISLSSYGQSKAEITALPSYQKGLITVFGEGKSYPVKLPDYQLPTSEEFKDHNTLADYTLLWYYARMETSLGKVCFDNKDYSCAQDFLEKALSYTPNQLYLVRTLGLIYENEQKCDQAEQQYKKVLVLNPKALFAFSDLANLAKTCFKDETKTKYWQSQMAGKQNGPAKSLEEL